MPDSPFIFDVDASNFEQIVLHGSQQVPVLVDFWAGWCQPCQILMPLLAKLADEYQGSFILAKVDTEQQSALAAGFGIRSLPTVKLFRDGTPVDEFMGALPEAEIRSFLDRHLPRAVDDPAVVDPIAQAEQRLLVADPTGALDLLMQARADDPTNPRVATTIARLQAANGDLDAAEQSLAELPAEAQKEPEVTQMRAQLFFDRVSLDAGPPELIAQRLAAMSNDSEARFQMAAHQIRDNDVEGAMENLLQLLQQDRGFGDDAARHALLRVFEMLGDDPAVGRIRTRMFTLLH